ncbi:MAG: hypothetical protein BWY59_02350 [Verrucomicrobia bacterium ADurb.Bin345]|nr:MAG: hypothetical protein BWY59_02350 [Verrucomicrobia bacterium ADurb.Bin345]
MLVQQQPPLHLTYCLNIHPGESWAENFRGIHQHALEVKNRVCPDRPFGLGLRLGRAAADALAAPARRHHLRDFLRDHGLYVFTINGFPYGQFHGGPVKERVYSPDWRTPERLHYTNLLADILADLLPEGMPGSISTVPGSWKPWIRHESDLKSMTASLTACAQYLAGIRTREGADIALALEPEPGCFLDVPSEAVRFFREHLFPGGAEVQRHVGICMDACHVAVQFEQPAAVLAQLLAAGIRVPKVQLSSALEADGSASALKDFSEPVYLHQVRARAANGAMTSWTDLPLALASGKLEKAGMVRVHFHMPLYMSDVGEGLRTTSSAMDDAFFRRLKSGECPHLEIETYTFDVLPDKPPNVVDHIVRELEWVLQRV